MAGRHASEIGAWDNGALYAADQPSLAHYLSNAGYDTVLSGKMHFIGPDQVHGFNRRLTTDIYSSETFFDQIVFFCLELPGVARGIVFGAKSVRGTLGSGARLPQAFALRAAVLRLRALCCHGYRGHRHATVRRQRWRVVQ